MARVFVSYSYDPAEHDALRASVKKWLAAADATAAMHEVADWVIDNPAEGDAIRAWLDKRLADVDVTAVRELADWVFAPSPDVKVFPETATAQATAPTPTVRRSFTVGGSSPAEPKRGPLAGLSRSQKTALVIVLVWVIAYFLPLAQMALPEEYQTLLTDAAAWWGIALAVTFAIVANRK